MNDIEERRAGVKIAFRYCSSIVMLLYPLRHESNGAVSIAHNAGTINGKGN